MFSKDKVTIIAEVSANHGNKFEDAIKMVKAVKDCGADVVKFQAYKPDTMTIDMKNDVFMINHPEWGGQSLYELYEKACTPWEWFKPLKDLCDELELGFLVTAFDKSSVDYLQDLGVTCHKVASFELVDISLIEHIAKTNKPIVISTGMGSLEEIQDAVNAFRKYSSKDICLLKCTSAYPAKEEEMNLWTITDMQKKFNVSVGFSDHSLGTTVAELSVPLGVSIIEKHFTLSRKTITPDSFFSIEPEELKLLVSNVRRAEKILGSVHYGFTEGQEASRTFRRSLFVVQGMDEGEIFTEKNLRSIRPGVGLLPKHYESIIGKTASCNIKRGTPLKWRLIKCQKAGE